VPIGDCEGIDAAALVAFVEAWFGLPVACLPPVAVSQLKKPGLRRNDFGDQILTTSVCDHLERHRMPPGAFCAVGFSMVDLYPNPKWDFVFGEASPEGRVGVFSFARMRDAPGRPLLWCAAEPLLRRLSTPQGTSARSSLGQPTLTPAFSAAAPSTAAAQARVRDSRARDRPPARRGTLRALAGASSCRPPTHSQPLLSV
jgi:hypothetical protein